MPSIFSRIVAGEIPCHKIAEDDRFMRAMRSAGAAALRRAQWDGTNCDGAVHSTLREVVARVGVGRAHK